MFHFTSAQNASYSNSTRVRGLFAALAFFICLTFAQTAAAQQTFTVDNNSDTAGQSACTAAPNDCNLPGAVGAARNAAGDDTIVFAPGITNITLTTTPEIYLDSIGGSVTINGPGANVLTIDGGTGTNRIFRANGAVFNLSGVTLTGGNGAGGDGGAVNVFGGTVTFNGVHFLNNSSTVDGGGISIVTGGNHRIENSTFSGNTATRNGGAIYIVGTGLTVVNSTVSGNSASNVGGGIVSGGAGVTLRSVTITDNSAPSGGGVQFNDSTVDFGNTIIAGNTATSNPEISLSGSTAATSQGYNLIGDSADDSINTSIAITYQSTDIRDTPPLLAPLGNYGGQTFTHALLSGSPAINAGNGALSGTPTTDQRGAAREGAADIGAFEVNASFVAVLPSGYVNRPYYQLITRNNGAATYTLVGTLPPGLNLTTVSDAIPAADSGKAARSDLNSAAALAPQAVVAIEGTPTMAGTYNFAIETSEGGNTNVTNYQIVVLAPTAASVSVGGRVLAGKGTGLRNAVVRLTDSNGVTRSAITGAFGYYRFDNVAVGETHFVSVRSKNYFFDTQIINPTEDASEMNFFAQMPFGGLKGK